MERNIGPGFILIVYWFKVLTKNLMPIAFVLLTQWALAQDKEAMLEKRITIISELRAESLESDGLEESDIAEWVEMLEYYTKNPIDLNTADFEDFKKLGLLNDIQISRIINHREQYHGFLSVEELQSVEGFDAELVSLLLPFFKVTGGFENPSLNLKHLASEGKHQFMIGCNLPLEKAKGYQPVNNDDGESVTPYQGSSLKMNLRYRFSYYDRLSIGVATDKDGGEALFKEPTGKGFDFYSAHFYLKKKGFIKTLALGDYNLQIGQGLLAWTGFGAGKTTASMIVNKNATGLKPYTSFDENRFLRGAGIEIIHHRLSLICFTSYKYRDGNVLKRDSADGSPLEVSSLPQSGLHRTLLELEKKNQVKEWLTGMNLNYKYKGFHAGLSAMYQKFSVNIVPDEKPYAHFDFKGNESIGFSMDYGWVKKNISLFGEAAFNANGSFALLNGLQIGLGRKALFTLLGRSFSPGYYSMYASAFSESNRVCNEQGLYSALSLQLGKGIDLFASADYYRIPWLSFRLYSPSWGSDYTLQFGFHQSKKIDAYLRYRYKEIEQHDPQSEGQTYQTIQMLHRQLRLHLGFYITESITLKNRIEWLWVNKSNGVKTTGFLIYQDLLFRPLNKPFDVTIRYAIFDASDYDSRLYAFENGMPGDYSFPVIYGKGIRTYLLLKYQINHFADAWLKVSRTFYPGEKNIGSGYDQIEGDHRTDLKLQIRFKF